MAVLERLRWFECIYFVPLFIAFTTLSLSAVISFVIYILVYLLSCFFPNYGQFINYTDVLLDEDLENCVPQNSLVVTITLQGKITLEELKSLFTQNVLNANSKVNPSKLLYPKLKQYLTTFICFRIWKNDPTFEIRNHIVEKNWNGADIANIHQEYQNKPYQKYRSPWELVLIQNVNFNDNSGKIPTSVLVLRVNHVLGDAISLLKLIVEHLGNQQVKTASEQYVSGTKWENLKFILWFPINYTLGTIKLIRLVYESVEHPWRIKDWMGKSNVKTVIAFSSKISISNLKSAAKQNNVKVSAVVTNIIAGAVKTVCGESWDKNVAVGFILPIPNHPEGLTNHVTGTVLQLPVAQQCEFKRLQQCNQELSQTRDVQIWRYTTLTGLLAGLQIYPINRMFVNIASPMGITNNAGMIGEFSLGNAECIDCHGSVGTMRGSNGVVICTLSYKDFLRVAVIAKESVLPKETAELLANRMELELQSLLKTPDLP